MSLTTHSPQEPCPACGAFADWSEIINGLVRSLEKVLPYAVSYDPAEYGGQEPTQEDDIEQAQAIIDKVRSLLPEERRE